MSRTRLSIRLAVRDLRRRTTETMLLLVALGVAATTLTVGLVLHGQTGTPYAETRAATAGPDIVATVFPPPRRPVSPARLAALSGLAHAPAVMAASGLLPQTWASLDARGIQAVAAVQGRASTASPVDRPRVVSGTWVRAGGVVLERAFAVALGVHVGDRVLLGGAGTTVIGIAVSAALPPYPQVCTVGCILDQPGWGDAKPGLVWATRSAVRGLATHREPLAWFQYLRLADPRRAPSFAAHHGARSFQGPVLFSWQEVARRHAELLRNERAVVLFGSSLLVLLALATVVVLVGGRMADEVRRVGTLKAVGASPAYVVRVLLTSYLAVGLVASLTGLAVGRLVAPLLVRPSAGLLGAPGGTTVTPVDCVVVVAVVLGIVVAAVLLPAWRAARTSTIRALADAGRRPRRSRPLILVSSALPTAALLGVRLAARRPRRALLTMCSLTVAGCGGVGVLYAQASLGAEQGPSGGPADPNAAVLHSVLVALTALLLAMVAVILVFVTRAAVTEARGTLAVSRALGATPAQTVLAVSVAQLVPATVGVLVGLPVGSLVVRVLGANHVVTPPLWSLACLVLVILAGCLVLAGLAARADGSRPVAELLGDI